MAATITGTVFHDLNLNGVPDPGEPGIAGVTVVLSGPDGCLPTETGGDGTFSYSLTTPGRYALYESTSPTPSCPPALSDQPPGPGVHVPNEPIRRDFSVSQYQIDTGAALSGPNFSHAVRSAPLLCEGRMIQFVGRPTRWYDVDLVTGTAALRGQLDPAHDVNAVGYDPGDNCLYAYDETASQLVRVGADRSLSLLGLPAGLPAAAYSAGTVDPAGIFYLYATGAERFYAVDLRPGSPSYLKLVDPTRHFEEQTADFGTPLSRPVFLSDWAINIGNGLLYGVERGGTVVEVTPSTGRVLALKTTGPNPGVPFEAVAGDASGNLYAVSSADGALYRYTVEGAAARGVRFSSAVPGEFSDGAMCPYAEVYLDFGDAPDEEGGRSGRYNTLLASNGPRHGISAPLYLGERVTAEEDAYQNATATGDDQLLGIQDDGLSVPLPILSTSADRYAVTVSVNNRTGETANLYGWVDFNKNGIFEPDESAFLTVPTAPGVQSVPMEFTVPAGTALTPDHTFLRLRLTTDDLRDDPATPQDERSVGPASDGEVEDYLLGIGSSVDLTLKKSADLAVIGQGDVITYTLLVSNAGPDSAFDVRLEDALPPELTDGAYSLDGGVTWNAWTGSLGLGTLTAPGTFQALLRARLTGSPAAGLLTNTAKVTTSSENVNPEGGTATVNTPVNTPSESADLSVTKTACPSPAAPGRPLVYTVTARNAGPDKAVNTVLSDPLPAAEYSVDGGLCWQAWTGSLALGDLEAGTQTPVLLRMVPQYGISSLTNVASVNSDTPDPAPDNNTVTLVTPVLKYADLCISKRACPDLATPGQYLTYTLTVTNLGPDDAEDVLITDTPPCGLDNVRFSTDQGRTWAPWTGSHALGSLPRFTTLRILVAGVVRQRAPSPLVNTASVSASTPDPDPCNNLDCVSTRLGPICVPLCRRRS